MAPVSIAWSMTPLSQLSGGGDLFWSGNGNHFILASHYYPSDSPAKFGCPRLETPEWVPLPLIPLLSRLEIVVFVKALMLLKPKVLTPVSSLLNVTGAPISQVRTQLGHFSLLAFLLRLPPPFVSSTFSSVSFVLVHCLLPFRFFFTVMVQCTLDRVITI